MRRRLALLYVAATAAGLRLGSRHAVAHRQTRQTRLHGTRVGPGQWRSYDEVKTCIAGRRSYAPPTDFFDESELETLREVPILSKAWVKPMAVVVAYLAYPAVAAALALVPPPNPVEGGYFFSLVSIIFGTLTASTISDATSRLTALRSAVVEECSLMLPLLERLKVTLLEDHGCSDKGRADAKEVFEICANQLWLHSTDLICGTREIELNSIACSVEDPLLTLVRTLTRAQRRGVRNLTFALAASEAVMRARGHRLALEGYGVPEVQYIVLRALSWTVILAYAYLTLDRPETAPALSAAAGIAPGEVLGIISTRVPELEPISVLGVSGGVMDDSVGVRVLFAFVCGALFTFNSLASDFNQPFQGDNIKSQTVTSSLRQVRASIAPHVNLEGREVFIPDSAADDEAFDALKNAVDEGFFFPKFPGPYPKVGAANGERVPGEFSRRRE